MKRKHVIIYKVIISQLAILSVWVIISILQWMKSPSNPGVLLPLVVRGIEAFSVFAIGLIYIYIFEKISFKDHEFKLKHGLVVLVAIYIGSIASHILSISIRKLVGYSPPLLEFYKGYFFIRSTWFYLPLALNISIFIYFKIVYIAQIEREDKLKAESFAQQAKWMMLRYQVNPHFLFNALNTIRALIGVDDENARKTVTEMSEYFRYSLSSEDKYTVTIEKEINAVKNYLEIQKIRFQDKIEIEINVSKNSELCLIPVFSIQTLVENAVKYGLKTTDDNLHIIVECRYINGVLDIIVKNSGRLVYTQTGESTSKGIQNLRNRLGYLYPDKNTFSLFEKDGFVIAHISLKDCKNENMASHYC